MNGVQRTDDQILKLAKVHEDSAIDIACDTTTHVVSTDFKKIYV